MFQQAVKVRLHRGRPVGVAAILIAFVMAGCQSPFDEYEPWPSRSLADRLDTTASASMQRQRTATQPDEATASLQKGAGPEQYVSLALQRHPAIRSARHRIERLAARIDQATSLNDPMLQVAPFGEMTETAAGQTGLMAGVSQTLPLPAKLRTRGDIAEQDVAIAKQQLRQTKLRIAADVRRAYWNYYLVVRSIEVTKQNQRLLRQFREVAQAKYKAGTASQSDVLRASTELSNLENELATHDQRKHTATAMLNRLMDRRVDRPLPEPLQITFTKTALELQQLLRHAEAHNPELAQVRERIEQYRAKRRLAELNRWPDLTISANYNIVQDEGLSPVATGEDAWWFGVGINIPLWQDKRDAAEREAQAGLMQSLADLNDTQNTIAFHVQDALTRFRTQQDQVALFRDTILPQAEQTVEASMNSYRAGQEDFLAVIDNWRKLLQFRLAYHKALAQLKQDFADLQQQVGQTAMRSDDAKRLPPASQPITRPGNSAEVETHDE